jgi:hypothetical protein
MLTQVLTRASISSILPPVWKQETRPSGGHVVATSQASVSVSHHAKQGQREFMPTAKNARRAGTE